MGITFDGPNKLAVLTAGTVSLDVVELWSRWIDWLLTGDNSKYLPAMRSVGGDPLSETKDLGTTFFMTNGWRIRPQEADHWLTVNGNLYTDPSGYSPFVATLGSYTVTIAMVVSNLTDASLAQMAEIEYASFNGGVTVDEVAGSTGTDYPVGTPSYPVDNMADALAIATERGFKKFYIVGQATIDAGDFSGGYTFDGGTPMTSNIIVNGTANVLGCEFHNAPVSGYFDANTVLRDCLVVSLYNYDAFIYHSGLIGTTFLAPGAVIQCWDSWDATFAQTAGAAPKFDFSEGGKVALRNYSGSIAVRNMTHADDVLVVESHHGHVFIEASCTAGTVYVHSCDALSDNSNGTTVYDEMPLSLVRKILTNKTVEDETGVTLYEDDGTTEAGAWTWDELTKTRGKLA
jgi:hypothetical protein